jgi:hypothetical protein
MAKKFQGSIGPTRQRDECFDEDFVAGAVTSLQMSTRRIQWRESSGQWPSERIGKFRQTMEDQIERLIKAEIERHRLGEVTARERSGPVIHRRRRGVMRMTPTK